MKKKLTVCFSFFLCSCAMPASPPPPPPLPALKSEAVTLTMFDLTALNQMNEWSSWMISLGEATKIHSNRPVIINYGTRLVGAYQKQKEAIKTLLKNHFIELTNSLPFQKQKRLSSLETLYGRRFDQLFLKEISNGLSNSVYISQKEDELKRFSKDIIPLIKEFLRNNADYQSQAHDLLRSEQ